MKIRIEISMKILIEKKIRKRKMIKKMINSKHKINLLKINKEVK